MIQVSLLIILIFAQRWIMSSFEEKIMESAKGRAVEAADGIINGMNMLMLTGQISDPKNRGLFIKKMAQSPGIRDLRIFRAEQVKKQFGPGLPEEQPLDDIDRNTLNSGTPYFEWRNINHSPSLRAVVPFIANRNFRGTDCLACHDVKVGSVNGAASISLDLSAETAMIKSLNFWLWLGQVFLQIVLFIVIDVMIRSFTNPLRKLQGIMTAMQADGDLSKRISFNGRDEIGRMGEAFNALAESLQTSVNQVKLSAQVFVNSNEAIVITDQENNIIQINNTFTEITGYALEDVVGKNPRVLKSGKNDPDFYRAMWDTLLRTGHWQGEVTDRRKNGEIYQKWLSINLVRGEKGEITNYIGLFSDLTERKASYARIQRLAHFDALTNLPNRALLNDHLDLCIAQAKRNQTRLAIIFLDLDRFKKVNDSLGHHAGDLLLQAVAERLKDCVRETDTVARLGGDEFVILLSSISEPNDAARVAQKVVDSIANPFTLDGSEASIGTSIGIGIYPDNGLDHAALIKNADAAMYHAKENGRNNFQFFSSAMNEHAFERLSLENDLRRALKRDELFLHYQPQIDVQTGKVVGVEALIRWQHPEQGLIPPNQFIPLAEECGLIAPIGDWVVKTACAQNKAWQEEGLPAIVVAVNISAQHFQQKNFKELIAKTLADTNLAPAFLELEITESAIMDNAESMLEMLHSLKEMGVLLAIDDFGTGYSSLSYLKDFPIDKLKIDRSFVQNITSDSGSNVIAKTIINMGHSLNLKVIAEGVETPEQLASLRELLCDEIQGYHFSRPISAQDFVAFARKNSAPTHHHVSAAASGLLLDIGNCRVQRTGSDQVICMSNDSHCAYALPFGNSCEHPLAHQIANAG